jgi:hypothetical protein
MIDLRDPDTLIFSSVAALLLLAALLLFASFRHESAAEGACMPVVPAINLQSGDAHIVLAPSLCEGIFNHE